MEVIWRLVLVLLFGLLWLLGIQAVVHALKRAKQESRPEQYQRAIERGQDQRVESVHD
jgi:hypothetical protein